MRNVRVVNRSRSTMLAERVTVADSFLRRGWGLLGHAGLGPGEGMVITKTNSIHSMFMRFPFDALYVDKDGTVLRLLQNFPSFRVGPVVRKSRHVIELPAGTIARTGTVVGDAIEFEPGL